MNATEQQTIKIQLILAELLADQYGQVITEAILNRTGKDLQNQKDKIAI